MKTKQADFEIVFAEQAEANAELRKIASALSSRKELENNIKSYTNFITAMKDIPDWDKLYLDLNEVVKAAKNSSLSSSKNN